MPERPEKLRGNGHLPVIEGVVLAADLIKKVAKAGGRAAVKVGGEIWEVVIEGGRAFFKPIIRKKPRK